MRIFLLILFLTIQSFGQTYYISNTGNDSNDGLSTTTAWRTTDKLHSMWSSIVAGTNVLFERGGEWAPLNIGSRKGVIEVPDGKQGTANSPIYFGAYGTGDDPIIDGTQVATWNNSVFIAGAAHITFDNIHFKGSHLYRILHLITSQIGLTYYKVLNGTLEGGNMYFANTPCNDTHTGYMTGGQTHIPDSNDPYTSPIHHIEIGNMLFLNNTGEDAINLARGIRDIGGGAVVNGEVPDTNIWIHDNTFYNFEGEAIDIAGGDNHLIERNIASGAYVGASGGNVFKFHSQDGEFTNSVFRNNLLMGAQWTTSQAAFGFALWNVQGCWVYNNTVYSRHAAVIGDDDRSDNLAYYDTFENNKFYNNIWYGSFNIQGNAGVVHSWYTHNQVDSITFLNDIQDNIYKHNPEAYESRLIRIWNNGRVDDADCIYTVAQFNTRWLGSEYGQSGKGEKAEDPDLVNPTWTSPQVYGDFTPSAGGNLVDSGTVISGYDYDLNNTAVPQGAGYDIGAYEYGSGYSPGYLVSSPTSWNAGTIDVSDTTFTYLYISNSGDTTVTYAITFNDSTNFRLQGSGTTVSTETDTFKIIYDPSGAGSHTDSIIIAHDGVNGTKTIPLSGTAGSVTPASLVVSFTDNITSLTFGTELLTNNTFSSFVSGDPVGWTVSESPPNSEISSNSGARIYSDGTWVEMLHPSVCTENLMYKYENTINVTSGGIKLDAGDGAVSSDIVMSSTGTHKGIIIADQPNWSIARNVGGCDATITYASVKLASGYLDTVLVSKTGDDNLTGTATLKYGTDFEIVSGSTIFNSTSVIVRYKPTAEGTDLDSIIIQTNGGDTTLAINGTWGSQPNPVLEVSETSHDFGVIDAGQSVTDTIYAYNIGTGTINGTVTILGLGFTLLSSSSFSITTDTALVIYRFYASDPIEYSAELRITWDSNIQSIYLSGEGYLEPADAVFNLSASSWNAGLVDTSSSKSTILYLTNLGEVSLDGTYEITNDDFSVLTSGTYSLTTGSHEVGIKFAPQTPGNKSASLIFSDNTGVNIIPLSGVGGTPIYSTNKSFVDFGSVRKNTTSYVDVVVTNLGTGSLTGTASIISLNTDYAIVSSATLTNGGTIRVGFTPSTATQSSIDASLYIQTNVGNYTIPLYGYGYLADYKVKINKTTTARYLIIEE